MADPDIPARTYSKRKRCAALPEHEEVTREILNELRESRINVDKKLAKFNNSFMQTQARERQRFIEYCGTRLRDLNDGVRPIVVAKLLSSEDFAVDMNFSEVHTSNARSRLMWSCKGDSLSDPAWRTVLQQYFQGSVESSSSLIGKITRTPRATTKGAPPRDASPTPIAESPAPPISMTPTESDGAESLFIEDDETDSDVLSTRHVTISRPKKARTQKSPETPLENEVSLTGDASSKPAYHWTEQECDTLKKLCDGKHEAVSKKKRIYWEKISDQFPGRSASACYVKWLHMQRGQRGKGKPQKTGNPRRRIDGVHKDLTNK